jgi:hypothetical protein
MLKTITRFSCVGLVIASILTAPNALAQSITYIPQTPKASKTRETQASTSRGCPQNLTGLVEPLAPSGHVGLTRSARPTLLFKLVHPSPVPAFLVVAAIDGREALVEQALSLDTPGVKSVSFPPLVELELNKEYIWSIVLICNRVRPSDNFVVQALLKRIAPTPVLIEQLKKASSSFERGRILAANGIWYDALAEVRNNPLLLQELINQKEGLETNQNPGKNSELIQRRAN